MSDETYSRLYTVAWAGMTIWLMSAVIAIAMVIAAAPTYCLYATVGVSVFGSVMSIGCVVIKMIDEAREDIKRIKSGT